MLNFKQANTSFLTWDITLEFGDYNGTTVILDQFWSSNYELNLFSDSAGGKGKGFGICPDRKWVQACWSNSCVCHAKFRDPNKDCKSCNEILVQAKQDSILFRNSISFSSGSSITMLIVLNSIPRNIKTSVGSTVLLSARGTPHSLQES
jgi:hypothetical protein